MTKARGGVDILHGSLWKGIPRFALPVAATGILEQLSGFVNTLMIGRFAADGGTFGMAAVGSVTPIASLFVMLFVGLSLGANVAIARAVGAGEKDRASRCAHTAVALSAAGVVFAIVLELLSRPMLLCLNVPPEVFDDALLYLRVYLIGMPAILLYNFEAAIFRSVGVTRMPLVALAISAVLNVVLDGIFIAVLGWDEVGVALATVLCYVASSGFLFVRLLGAQEPIRITPARLRVDRAALREIVRVGVPAGIQGGAFSIANVLIQTCINSLGPEVVAASSASLALEYVCYSLLNSFSQACTTFVGQNDGANNLTRCKGTLRVCLVEGAVSAIVMIGLVVWQGRVVLSLFNPDTTVIDLAYVRVCIIFPVYVFSMAYENMSGYLRGFGISGLPSALTVLGVCGTRFIWALVVFPMNPTFANVMLAYPVSLGLTAVLIAGALAYADLRRSGRGREGPRRWRGECDRRSDFGTLGLACGPRGRGGWSGRPRGRSNIHASSLRNE